MAYFFLQRLIQSLLVMLTVAFVAFLLFNHIGDPISSMLSADAGPEDRERMRMALGLNDPFYVQYTRQLQKISIGESVQPDIHAVSWPMWHVVQVHQL